MAKKEKKVVEAVEEVKAEVKKPSVVAPPKVVSTNANGEKLYKD